MTQITATAAEIDSWLHTPGYNLGPAQFTFSISTATSTWPGYGAGSEPLDATYSFADPALAAGFRAAIAVWDSIIAPDFVEVADDASTRGEVRVAYTDTDPAFGYAYSGTPVAPGGLVGDVWMDDSTKGSSWLSGTYPFQALLHEIGHTLGLKHTFEAPVVADGLDDTRYSIMSYTQPGYLWSFSQNGNSINANAASPNALTPMVLDVAAAQAIYGVETTTRTGNDTYTFTPWAATYQTICDAGGTDTVDVSNFTLACTVDLRAGSYSSLGRADAQTQIDYWTALFPSFSGFIADVINDEDDLYTFTDNLGIAFSATIENATGGAGADTIIGNSVANTLNGGAGADQLYGGAGNDTFLADTQADLVFENAGEGTDSVLASSSYYLYAEIETLTLAGAGDTFGVGNALANTITGNEGSNLLIAGLGNDTVHGGGGVDSLFGEDGADALYGDAGIDYLVGGVGNDTLDGGADADAVYGEAGDDTLTGGTGFVTDILVGGDGNDTLRADSGMNDYDLIDGGAGNDAYYVDTGDDLTFEGAGGGTDTVYADVAGANNGVYLYAEVENLVLLNTTAFGVGNELANTLTGSASGNWLLGGAGNDSLNGKAGGDVLFGEAGNDTFVFEHGTGGDVIGDFTHGSDKMNLADFHFASFAALQNSFHQAGSDGAIDLGGGDFVVLLGVTMATLDAGDFVL
jgi:Ca2+-binding RTX toxin-like protein